MTRSRRIRLKWGATGALALLLAGCGLFWRPPEAPLRTVLDKSSCTPIATTLLVMLPGAYSNPEEFAREGFVAAVQERKLAVDVLRVDAQVGYYYDTNILTHLRDDVISPARAQGYTSIWILGISVGGFGGLSYAATHPGDITGIVALAPYLGDRTTSIDIANAGGLSRWQAPTEMLPGDKGEQRLWRWLQRYGTDTGKSDLPKLYVGFGIDDRFAFSDRLLAALLPADQVFLTPGGHDWPEWRRLWTDMLPILPLPACVP
jgi:pimeloyl-ACP methyl ester carboxylesterase